MNKKISYIIKQDPFLLIGLIILILLFMQLICSFFISDYNTQDLSKALLPIGSEGHIFGTDQLGRDILHRVLVGSQYSIFIGLSASILSLLIGILLGTLSGFYSGFVDNIIMRFTDIVMSFPTLLLIIAISISLPNNILSIIIVIGVSSWTSMARLIRSQIIMIKSKPYFESSQALGFSNIRIIFNHLLPNCMGPIIIFFTLGISNAIMAESSLAFLGLGIQSPTPTWGGMINDGKNFLRIAHHLSTIPGLFICLTVLAFNLVGESLRDHLDVKIK